MRHLLWALGLALSTLTAAFGAEGSGRAWPLWDGQESTERYAVRAHLPRIQSVDVGSGVQLELVLIPAGQFVMGTPAPLAPVETAAYGKTILTIGAGALAALLLAILIRALIKWQRPKFSLGLLLLLVFVAGAGLYGGVRSHQADAAWRDYRAALARYDAAPGEEKPGHDVTLTRPFYMSKFPVTQQQYRELMGRNHSHFQDDVYHPADVVTWDDAQTFCARLSAKTGRHFRLPTEAEWEFGCRAGTTTKFYSGDLDSDLDRVAWYRANSAKSLHPVGKKAPNAFGLYDMHGNVWQWCQDFCSVGYPREAAVDPHGPDYNTYRIQRGGAWDSPPRDCRTAYRGWAAGPSGFRVAMDVGGAPGAPKQADDPNQYAEAPK